MRSILSIALSLLLFPAVSFAEIAVSTGSVTRANMRLSTINGVAFADFSAADVLTNYVGYKLKVCSVTNTAECVTGYIKAAGTGETYGSELATNGTFDTDTGWTKGTGWTISGGVATFNSASGAEMYQTSASTAGRLYKGTFDVTAIGSVSLTYQISSPGASAWAGINSGGSKTYYLLAAANYTRNAFGAGGTTNFSIDNFSRKQVVTPAATGVTITSTAGGSTYNWTTNGFVTASSFNDPLGYSYSIYPAFNQTITGNDNTLSYGLVDCADSPGMAGMLITGTGNTIQNYTVVRCPGGAFQFDESATLINSIGISSGADITIAAGKTVTAKNNLFGDAAKSGDGTYDDVGAATQWSTDPVFVDPDNGNFRLQGTSPAIDAGTRD